MLIRTVNLLYSCLPSANYLFNSRAFNTCYLKAASSISIFDLLDPLKQEHSSPITLLHISTDFDKTLFSTLYDSKML